MKSLITILAALALSACAQSPDAIAPVAMGNAYAASSCSEARTELAAKQSELTALSIQQNNAVTGDAIGVFLLAIPMSSVTGGDKEGLIATTKGQILALQQRLSSC